MASERWPGNTIINGSVLDGKFWMDPVNNIELLDPLS
jgi:hypothetical protein